MKVGSCSFHDNVAISPKTLVLSPFLCYHLLSRWQFGCHWFLSSSKQHESVGVEGLCHRRLSLFTWEENLISRSNGLSLTFLWLELSLPTLARTGPHAYPRPLTRKRKGIAITMNELGHHVSNFTAHWNHPGRLTSWCLSLRSRDSDEIVLAFGLIVRFKFPRYSNVQLNLTTIIHKSTNHDPLRKGLTSWIQGIPAAKWMKLR